MACMMYCTSIRPFTVTVRLMGSLEENRERKVTKNEEAAVTVGCSGS